MFKGGLLRIRGKNVSNNIKSFLREKFTHAGAFVYPLEKSLALILEPGINVDFYKGLIEEVFRNFGIRVRIAISCDRTILKVLDRAYYNLRSSEVENIVYDVNECRIEELISLFIPNYTLLNMSFSKYMKMLSQTFNVAVKYEGIIIPYENGSYIGFIPKEGIKDVIPFRKYLGIGVHEKPSVAVKNAISDFKGELYEN